MRKLFMTLPLIMITMIQAGVIYSDDQAPQKKYNFAFDIQPLPVITLPMFKAYDENLAFQFVAGPGDIYLWASVSGEPSNYLFAIEGVLSYRFVPFPNPEKGSLDGFYIGPGIEYITGSPVTPGNVTVTPAMGTNGLPTVPPSSTQISGFMDIGYQWIFNGFHLDIGFGGGYGFYEVNYYKYVTTPYIIRFTFALGYAF